MGPFQARVNQTLTVLPHSVTRLLALIAVVGPSARTHAAALLWPDADRAHASANLRTALARLNAIESGFLDLTGDVLSRPDDVGLDIDEVTTWVNRTIYGRPDELLRTAPPPGVGSELLPGWDDEWLSDARERLRLLQAQALESAAEKLLLSGHPGEALPYALLAVQSQPWSESANRLMIEIHARRGDPSNALRRYRRFRAALEDELGVQPGPDMTAIVRQLYPFANLPA